MELRSRSPQGYDFSELKSNLNAINNYKTALSKGLGYWYLNENILFINTVLKRDKKASMLPAKTQNNVNQLTLMNRNAQPTSVLKSWLFMTKTWFYPE